MKYWQVLILLFIVALSLRTARCFIVDRISKDGVLYVKMAESVALGEKELSFVENRRMPPLYIQFIAVLHRFGISFESGGRVISVLAGSLLVIPFFLVVRLFFGDRAAFISGLLVVVHPSLVKVSSTVMRDSLFLSLMVFSFSFIVFAIHKRRYFYWGTAGFFAALASATRAEGVELILAVLLWMSVSLIRYYMVRKSEKNCLCIEEGGDEPAVSKGDCFSFTHTVAGPMIFILLFFVVSFPISESVRGTSSTWSVIDSRIIGYARNLLSHSSEEALKREDTL